MVIDILNAGFKEEANGGPRYQPSIKVVGERGKASWTRRCSLKSHNSALLAVLGILENYLWCTVPNILQKGWYRGAYTAHCPKEAEG